MTQREIITPNSDYPIAANLWDLNGQCCAVCSSSKPSLDVHSSLQHDVESTLSYMRELQKYSEKLSYESTCCRLWADGIQTQIKDEQEKVDKWIAGMTEDRLRKRT